MNRCNEIFKTEGSLRRKNKEGSDFCGPEKNQMEESAFNDLEVQHYIGKNKFVYLSKNQSLTDYSVSFWKKGYDNSKTEQNKKNSNNKRVTHSDVHKKKKTKKKINAEDLHISSSNSKYITPLKRKTPSNNFLSSSNDSNLISSRETHPKNVQYSSKNNRAASPIKKFPNGFQSSSNNSKSTSSTRQELQRDSQSCSNNTKHTTSSTWKEHSKFFKGFSNNRKYTTLSIGKDHPKSFKFSSNNGKRTTSSIKEILPKGFQKPSKRKKSRKVKSYHQTSKSLVRQKINTNTKGISQKKQNIQSFFPLSIRQLKNSRARQRYQSKKKDNKKRNIRESLRYQQRKLATNVRRNERSNLIASVLTDDIKPGSLWCPKAANNRLEIRTLKSTNYVLYDNRLKIKNYLKINTVAEKPLIENYRKQVAYKLTVNNDRSMIVTRLSKYQIVREPVYLPTRQKLRELKAEKKLKRKLQRKKKSVLEDERYVTPIFDNTSKPLPASHKHSQSRSKKKYRTTRRNVKK